jgi:hypothetical protein
MRWVMIRATGAGMLHRQELAEQQAPLMQEGKPMLIQKLKERQVQLLLELHGPARKRELLRPILLSGPGEKEETPPVHLQVITGMTMVTDPLATREIITVMTGLITMTGIAVIKIHIAIQIAGTVMLLKARLPIRVAVRAEVSAQPVVPHSRTEPIHPDIHNPGHQVLRM